MFASMLAIAAVVAQPGAGPTEITVYNQGFALVKEVRRLDLKAGRQVVRVEDVAARIEPTSVGIRSLSGREALNVLEQNFQFDLISPTAILQKSIGQRVRFVRTLGNQRDVLEGVLLSAPTTVVPTGGGAQTFAGMVIRTDDGRIVLDPTGEVEVASVPSGLISKPTLLWDLEAAAVGAQNVEISYLTQGVGWSADYVVTLVEGSASNLRGWVTVTNQSGTTFEDARLKLLAGDVERARQPMLGGPGGMPMVARAADSAKSFEQEALFEYHLYTLQRPATVRNNEIKQISLLESERVSVEKKLIVDAMQPFGRWMPQEGEVGTGDIKPQVRVEFRNVEANGLGIPLPKGTVKVYQRDKNGSVQLLGEDSIDHTPREERLSLVVGRSFDVVSSRKRTAFTRLSPNSVRETFEVELRNRKETAETVHVLERPFGDWRVTQKSQEFEKLDANTIQFVVKLAPNEVKKVVYTVETRW